MSQRRKRIKNEKREKKECKDKGKKTNARKRNEIGEKNRDTRRET